MIISASRRCDIPNYQSDWFLDAVKNQELAIPKDLFLRQRLSLKPEDVDGIVFWTKNPAPMIPRLHELDAYTYYFQFTLTGYSQRIEPGVPEKHYMLGVFQRLSKAVGAERVIWRYDPIFLSQDYTLDYHKKAFGSIASALSGCTRRCVISFIDLYGKVRERTLQYGIREPSADEILELAVFMAEMASRYGFLIETCSEKADLLQFGIRHGHCIDAELLGTLSGKNIPAIKDPSQRALCGCAKSVDIGTYHTCKNGCVYCYAS